MAKRAVNYARVSTDEQAKGYSLLTQLEAGRRYAAEKGYTLVAEFTDDYTGASLDRPGLNQLRECVAANRVEKVIIYDVDRLARKSVYQMLIEEELSGHGATVEYVNGQYADTDEGRLQKQIKASIAEYEKAKILERSKRGKRGKAQSGFVLVAARPPYGYQVKKEPHKSWLEIVEEEEQIIRMVFEWYTRGDEKRRPHSIREIAKMLTDMHIPTRGDRQKHFAKKRGAGVWSGGMIRHILMNETYTGIWHYGKTRMMNDGKESTRKAKPKRGLGKQVTRPREEWIAVDVPQIIDRKTFEQAKTRLEKNKREGVGMPAKHQYLLARRLRCAVCDYTFVGLTRREKHLYYYCNGCRQYPKVCDMPYFHVEAVDTTVWEWVKSLMQHPEQISAGLRADQAEAERAHSTIRERLSLIDARLADTQSQLEKVLDLYLQGSFPKEVLTERKARLEKDAADLTRERAEWDAHLQTVVLTDQQIAEIEAFCADVQDGLDNATFEDKRRYFELLDVRGKLAIENDERVIYIQCRIAEQRLSLLATSPLLNTGGIAMKSCACRPIRLSQ